MEGSLVAVRTLRVASVFAVAAVLEVFLIGKVDPQETPVGLLVAALATAALFAAVRAAGARFRVQVAWLGVLALVARNTVRDTFVIAGALAQRLAGHEIADGYQEVPFEAGGDDPPARARRGIVEAAVSTSPNAIVVAIDCERGTLRQHVLVNVRTRTHSPWWPL